MLQPRQVRVVRVPLRRSHQAVLEGEAVPHHQAALQRLRIGRSLVVTLLLSVAIMQPKAHA